MTKRVKIVINAEFEAKDEPAANAALIRIPGELKITIQESKTGHALTGVIPDSVRVEIVKKSVT